MTVENSLHINLTKDEYIALRTAFNILDDIASEIQDANVDFFTFSHDGWASNHERTPLDVDNAKIYLDKFL